MPKQNKQWVVEPELQTGLYRHYKGGLYLVLGIAQHSEAIADDKGLFVIYVSLDGERSGPRMRARPLEMFLEAIPSDGEGKPTYIPRFEYMGNYHKPYIPTDCGT